MAIKVSVTELMVPDRPAVLSPMTMPALKLTLRGNHRSFQVEK